MHKKVLGSYAKLKLTVIQLYRNKKQNSNFKSTQVFDINLETYFLFNQLQRAEYTNFEVKDFSEEGTEVFYGCLSQRYNQVLGEAGERCWEILLTYGTLVLLSRRN